MLAELKNKENLRSINKISNFTAIIIRERNRSDRNNQKFALIMFNVYNLKNNLLEFDQLLETLSSRLRISDEIGWYDEQRLAVLLPDTSYDGAHTFANSLYMNKPIIDSLFSYTVYMYPSLKWTKKNDFDDNHVHNEKNIHKGKEENIPVSLQMPTWKRIMDIFVSSLGLLVLSPFFLIIAVLIKVVSPGPFFFQTGKSWSFR